LDNDTFCVEFIIIATNTRYRDSIWHGHDSSCYLIKFRY